MSQLIRKMKQVSCAVVGHSVSEDEEDKLYRTPTDLEGIRQIESKCERCNTKLNLKVNPTDEDEYLVTEIRLAEKIFYDSDES